MPHHVTRWDRTPGHSGGGHFVYSIVGDCANTASRIEGLNKHLGSEILATGSTIEGIDGLLLRPLGQFIFAGKSEALEKYEVLSLATDATERQLELCDRFSSAIDHFQDSNWDKASSECKSILRLFPQDGLSLFYNSRWQRRLKGISLADNPGAISMTGK